MSSKLWYYATAEGSQGPVDEEELFRLVEQDVIRPETLVWTEGLAAWTPAGQLAVIDQARHHFEPPPPPPDPVQRPRSTLRPSAPDPVRRFAARNLDFLVFQMLVLPLIGPLDTSNTGQLAWVLGSLYLSWALIESILLSTLGYTPGKWMLRIEVTDPYGRRLDFVRAMRRSFDVAVRGVGLGLPFFHIFAQLFGLYQLTGKGITPWDRAASCVVTHRPLELSRWLIFLMLVLLMYQQSGGWLEATP